MPFTCSVTNCMTNVKGHEKGTVFKFPKDEGMQQKWISAIKRENFKITKHSRVCEKHFKASDIRTEASAYRDNGEKIVVRLQRKGLEPHAIPSKFLDCLKKPSRDDFSREDPESKRLRIENEQLEVAIQQSVKSMENEDRLFKFTSYSEFYERLANISLPRGWEIIKNEATVRFLFLPDAMSVVVKCSLLITNNLDVSAFVGKSKITHFKKGPFPDKVNDVREVIKLLKFLQKLTKGKDLNHVHNIFSTVRSFTSLKEIF